MDGKRAKVESGAYTRGPIVGTMIRTGLSMLPGTLAMGGYTLADTYYIGLLGTNPLAAMGYSLPATFLVNCVFHGLGAGIMTTTAHALGGRKQDKAARLASSGLLLILLCSLGIGAAGYLTVEPLFRLYGAEEVLLPILRDYMGLWFLGCATIALSMVGNNLLVAAGAPGTASAMTILGMLLNVFLTPVFAFESFPVCGVTILKTGFGLGIRGAILATILAQGVAALGILTVLRIRLRLVRFDIFELNSLLRVWRAVLRFGIPATLGMSVMPIGITVTTWIVGHFGKEAVAAVGAAGRLEMLAFVFPMSLGIALMPMIAQNYGAGEYERIDHCRRFAMRFALLYLSGMALAYVLFAPRAAGFFSDDPNVCGIMTSFLRIVPFGFPMIEIHRFGTFAFTGCNRPVSGALLNALRILGLMIPFSFLALALDKLEIVFYARFAADLIAGGVVWYFSSRLTRRLVRNHPKQGFSNPAGADASPPNGSAEKSAPCPPETALALNAPKAAYEQESDVLC